MAPGLDQSTSESNDREMVNMIFLSYTFIFLFLDLELLSFCVNENNCYCMVNKTWDNKCVIAQYIGRSMLCWAFADYVNFHLLFAICMYVS